MRWNTTPGVGMCSWVTAAAGVLLPLFMAGSGHLQAAVAESGASQGGGKPVLAPGANVGTLQPVPPPNLEYADDAVRFALRETQALLDSLLAQPGVETGELANAFGETGLLYHAHLAFEPARVCYRNAAILAPDDSRWPYYLAYLHQQNGRLEQAAESYVKALDLRPDLKAARLRLGQTYLELGQWAQAGPLLDGLAGVPEFRGAALFGAGKLAYARQEFERARDRLQRAIAASPRASRIHYTLALTYRALGDLDRARYHLSRRGDTEPRFPDPLIDDLEALTTGQRTLFHSAMNAVYQGEYALAVRVFREGLRLDPDNLNARVSLARSLYLDGDRDGAEAELRTVLSQAPERPLANFLLGALYQEAGLSERALAHYRAALRVEPEHAGANFFLADSLSRLGDYSQAARHYALSLRQEPDNKHARLREVLALIKGGAAHRKLRERLETAHAREPGDAAFAFLLAALLAASPDQALRDGKRAQALAAHLYETDPMPANAELLAMAHAEIGDFEKAMALQNKAIRMAVAANRLDLIPGYMDKMIRFQAEKPCRAPWREQGLPLRPAFTSAKGAFRDYPADSPY